jgi:hypothetical protein
VTAGHTAQEALAASAARVSRDRERCWERYVEWCTLHGLRPLPATGDTVALYLYAHRDAWTVSTARSVLAVIQRAHAAAGYGTVRTPLVQRLLAAWRRTTGVAGAPKVDAAASTVIGRLVGQIYRDAAPDARTRLVQTMVLVGARERLGTAQLRRLDWAQLTATGGDGRIRLTPEEQTVLGTGPLTEDPAWAVQSLAQRSKHGARGLVRLTPHVAAGLAGSELQWARAAMNHRLAVTLRFSAYLTVGHHLAMRHNDLQRHRLEDIEPSDEGFTLVQQGAKSRRDTTTRHLAHSCGDTTTQDTTTPNLCPACALGSWLEYLQVVQRVTRGPLLAVRYGGRIMNLTAKGANYLIRETWRRSGGDPRQRFSTRSLRAGRSTEMVRAGASLTAVMAVTGHVTVDEALRYIRSFAPAEQFRLPV